MLMLQAISDASALFILWLFTLAAIHKLNPANQPYFSALLTEHGWPFGATLIIKLVGAIELVIGLAIVYPASRPLAALAASGLLLTYLAVMAYQLYQGRRDLDCGCAGPAGALKISGHLLVRNLILAAIALLCLLPGQGLFGSHWLFPLGLATVGILIHLCCEQLVGNAQKLKLLRN